MMKVYGCCAAVYVVVSAVGLRYAPGVWPIVLLFGVVIAASGIVAYQEGMFRKKKRIEFSKEKRARIVKIIAREFEYPVCDNCAHYTGCAGGHHFGPPCSECHEGMDRYEPDYQTREANDKMFAEIEEVLGAEK